MVGGIRFWQTGENQARGAVFSLDQGGVPETAAICFVQFLIAGFWCIHFESVNSVQL